MSSERGEDHSDYLGALQRYRANPEFGRSDDPRLMDVSSFLLDYPFTKRLFPRAREVIRYLSGFGTTVIVSDGDVVFQPRKLARSGLREAVGGRVIMFIHKDDVLALVEHRFPAQHYVMVDERPEVLCASKRILGKQLTTIRPRQRRHIPLSAYDESEPPVDLIVDRIGDLIDCDIRRVIGPQTELLASPNE